MPSKEQPIIIIKKRKKGGDHGHHGGAWKVAYADFVTAMMAFFLLLWLLNVTTSDQKQGLADYFAPASPTLSQSGAGGVMGGVTLGVNGARMSSGITVGEGALANDPSWDAEEKNDDDAVPLKDTSPTVASGTVDSKLLEAIKAEQKSFDEVKKSFSEALEASPELKQLSENLLIDITPEGLRIQIVDRDGASMFALGSIEPDKRGLDLLRLTGRIIARLPNAISVTGHTDSTPFPAGASRDNWSLSLERADVSRTVLVNSGVDGARLTRVAGVADRDPLVKDNPREASNRLISIVLLRQQGALSS